MAKLAPLLSAVIKGREPTIPATKVITLVKLLSGYRYCSKLSATVAIRCETIIELIQKFEQIKCALNNGVDMLTIL